MSCIVACVCGKQSADKQLCLPVVRVQALYKQLVDIMRGFGIEAVPTVGAEFDPEIHEAMMREYSDEVGKPVACCGKR